MDMSNCQLTGNAKAYQKAYREANRDRLRALHKAYREAHREKLREYGRAYRLAHQEAVRAYQKAYRDANGARIAALRREYRDSHHDELRQKAQQHRATNKDAIAKQRKAHQALHIESEVIGARQRRKAYYDRNRDRLLRANSEYRLRQRYGLTREAYLALYQAQQGKCAICTTPIASRLTVDANCQRGGLAVVDHDHDTGTVRGLLCRTCNGAMGLFNDRISLLSAAIAYLSSAIEVP